MPLTTVAVTECGMKCRGQRSTITAISGPSSHWWTFSLLKPQIGKGVAFPRQRN